MSESQNIIKLKACKDAKELILTAHSTIGLLEGALYDILDACSIEAAKEIAADALGEDIEIYCEEDNLEELDFDKEPETIVWEKDYD